MAAGSSHMRDSPAITAAASTIMLYNAQSELMQVNGSAKGYNYADPAQHPSTGCACIAGGFGRGQTILLEREWIKCDTIRTPRLQHRGKAN